MQNLVIRKAAAGDMEIIRSLAETVWPLTYKDILSKEQIDYMMNLFYSAESLSKQIKKDIFLIAELNEEPVGFVSFSETAAAGIYKVQKLYVKTGTQGKGVGRALINFILDEIRVLNAKALELNVNRHNNARWFYEKMGFEVIREEDTDIGNDYWMNDYVMRLEI